MGHPVCQRLDLERQRFVLRQVLPRYAKQYAFPSYTLVDVGARYKTKLGKNTLTVSSAVENLFNKNYWQVQRGQYDRSFAVVGMPRTYWLKAELDF